MQEVDESKGSKYVVGYKGANGAESEGEGEG